MRFRRLGSGPGIPFFRTFREGILMIILYTTGTSPAYPVTFEGQTNIGRVRLAGSVQYDSAKGTYHVGGSGENMWENEDAFFFVWRRASGDLIMKAAVAWEGAGKHPHRKAGWMIRSGLEKNAPYVDAVVHGDGLISMQYRKARGETTYEVQCPVKRSALLLLERTGDQFTLSIQTDEGQLHPVGTVTARLTGDLYAGLAVCSHDSSTLETAEFSRVGFQELCRIAREIRVVESTLETVDVHTGLRQIVHRAKDHFEAPNWSREGSTLYYNSRGKIYTLPIAGGTPKLLNTAFADRCNNDHGISPDGNNFVISHHESDGKSRIYILPVTGGTPRLVTPLGPSYWHGWSPDGKTLAYCAERNGAFDVYTIPIDGGQEKRLTDAPGLDDGPEYSPDGKFIYFNSVRTGQMKIWRMDANGKNQVQFTPSDAYGDWFPHPSPDGKWIVFLSYDKSVDGHPANEDVVLRIMPATGGEPKILSTFFGGQGTINVPSWSPDSKRIAFVTYRLVSP